MNNSAKMQMPPTLNEQDFIAKLPVPGRGSVLVLATAELESLSTAMVAAKNLGYALTHLRIDCEVLVGRMLITGMEPVLAEHEKHLLAVGDCHEQLLDFFKKRGKSPQLVLYADPWAVNLDGTIVRHAPQASRIMIDDFVERVAQDADTWIPVIEWIMARPGVHFFTSASLITWAESILPFSQEKASTNVAGFQDRWDVLIDEYGGHPPAPEILNVLSEQYSQRVLLITPHIQWYMEHHRKLLERCAGVWRPSELSLEVYCGLMARTKRYVAPSIVPYGTSSLTALPKGAEAWVHEGTVLTAPLKSFLEVHQFLNGEDLHRRLASVSKSAQEKHVSVTTVSNQEVGPAAQWWRSLGNLVTQETISVKAKKVTPDSSPTMSCTVDFAFLACCYKYLQRFRIFIDSIVRQDYPLERIEVALALPGNPDGIIEYIDTLRMVYPQLGIRIVELPEEARRNKGKMINAAFGATSAQVVMSTDVDIVFPQDFVRTMLARHRSNLVLGCWRTPLSKEITAQILIGNLDPIQHFSVLQQQWDKGEETGGVRQGMLGYCQVVDRSVFEAVGYPEEFEGYNQSDIVFIDRLREQAGVESLFMKDYFVLHLSHSRDWTGTKTYL